MGGRVRSRSVFAYRKDCWYLCVSCHMTKYAVSDTCVLDLVSGLYFNGGHKIHSCSSKCTGGGEHLVDTTGPRAPRSAPSAVVLVVEG